MSIVLVEFWTAFVAFRGEVEADTTNVPNDKIMNK